MATRKQLWHPDVVRQKIKISQLLNRLHQNAFGKIELTPAQVRSIEILLKKSVPDLSAIQLSGDADNPVQTVTKIELVAGEPDDSGSD